MIRVHVACDNEGLRDSITALLLEDRTVDAVYKSAEAEAGAIAIDDSRPDVAILAVPPHEDTYRHAMLYRQAADDETALIGFCTTDDQADDYRLAGITSIAYLSSDTPDSMRGKVREAYESVRGGEQA